MPLENSDVLALIEARLDGQHDDGHRLGLAIEGGGMRGIVSGGMLLALRDRGLLDAFDSFYGTSSGGMNLAYMFGGASWEALTVYYDHLTSGFVHRRRWNMAEPLVDMHYGFDVVMGEKVPIDWATLRSAAKPVNTVLTNIDRVRSEIVDMRTLGDNALAYAKAASWMPMVAGRAPVVDGTRYLDGVVLCPDPVYAAINDGCTHVLLCNSSPQGAWPAVPRTRTVLRPMLNYWQPGLGEKYVDCRAQWDADRAAARFGSDVTMGEATVLRVAPAAGSHQVQQLTMRRDVLLDGARAGYRTVTELFGDDRQAYFSIVLR